MTGKIIDAEKSNQALAMVAEIRKRPHIQEVPNPLYKKKRDLYIPVPGSIPVSMCPVQHSLKELIELRERKELAKLQGRISAFCDGCHDCSDCAWSKELVSVERCEKIRDAMRFYIGSSDGK